MPSRSTIVVRNLPELTTQLDIKTFFDSRIKHAGTKVFPLVYDTQRAASKFKCTTVELNHAVRERALNLNAQEFIAAAGGETTEIEVDAALTGAVTLASHVDPQYDLYFVHGVGGNVFSSWVSESNNHMWPRDSFPEQSNLSGVRGRFSTIGYDAKVLDGGQPKTIQSAAEAIMAYVRVDRPPECTRPIFFVCHSLGGIVVTQALALALAKPADKPEYQFIQRMVGGVAYFGTPFQGSRNADFLTPFVSILGGLTRVNTNFVGELKTFSSNKLPTLMMAFNRIRVEEKIEVLVFVEKQPEGPAKVTTKTSATLPFQPMVVPVEIDANHTKMVKFTSGRDARPVITEIINMIKRKLDIPVDPKSLALAPALPILSVTGVPAPGAGEDNDDGFSQLSQFDTVFVIDDTGSMQQPSNSKEEVTNKTKSRWDVLKLSLQYIADIAARYDKDGVDIRFLMSRHLNREHIKNGQQVLNLLQQVDLTTGQGGTYFEKALAPILGPYVARYKKYFDALTLQEEAAEIKPLNVIIITDGADDGEEETEELLVEIAEKLDDMTAPKSQVGIQFLQVGDDKKAAEFLRRLDDDLKKTYKIRDFVDTKTFEDLADGQDFALHLRKILLGAVNRKLDQNRPTR